MSSYLDSNTTLIFLPGNHSLNSKCSISNVSSLILTSTHPMSAVITCEHHNYSTRFEFDAISTINISGLRFIGCGGNWVRSTIELLVENCVFVGQEISTTALELVGTTARVSRSSFNYNTFGSSKSTWNLWRNISQVSRAGGAVGVNQSDITIVESTFEGNSAEVGGAIFGEFDSNITIINSTFIGNSAASYNSVSGGVLHCQGGCTVTIHNGTFKNNTVIYFGYGAALSITANGHEYRESKLMISGTEFSNNKAFFGGAIIVGVGVTVSISESGFINNEAVPSGGGGAISIGLKSTLNIAGSWFCGGEAFTGGAISVSGTASVYISGSEFSNNKVQNGGGAISVNGVALLDITRSEFSSNQADTGGAISVWSGATVNISACEFANNVARSGSVIFAFYLILINEKWWESTNLIELSDSVIINNKAESGVIFLSNSKAILSSNISFVNNTGSLFLFNSNITMGNTKFFNNYSPRETPNVTFPEGGAITAFQSYIVFSKECLLLHNHAEKGGAILAIESKLFVYGDLTITANTATVSGGGVYLHQSELNCNGHSKLELLDNKGAHAGGGVYATSSDLKVHFGVNAHLHYNNYTGSSIHFNRNSARMGGGIYLETDSKIYVLKLSYHTSQQDAFHSIFFNENSADLGGAVYVADETTSATCDSFSYKTYSTSTECFLQSLALHNNAKPNLNLIVVKFTDNRAQVSGSALYGGLLDRCTVSPFAEIYYLHLPYLHLRPNPVDGITYFTKITNFTELNSITSFPDRVCFCESDLPYCNESLSIKVKKGERFVISLVAVDQVNHTVNATIHSSLSSNVGGLGEDQLKQNISNSCTNLSFNVYSPHDSELLILYAQGPCKDAQLSRKNVSILFLPCSCPVGFQSNITEATKCSCVCDPKLYPYITDCFPLNRTLLRVGSFWITNVNSTDYNSSSDYLIYLHCPLDYCYPSGTDIYLNFNVEHGSDSQCNYNRSGILCGKCKPSLSLSLGSSRCLQCSANWPTMLAVILIATLLAGMVLVAVLLMLNLTVATGTINGIIFYANIVNANSSTFLPFTEPNIISVFISWLNLELGIDTCLLERMDTYMKMWLRLAYPTYAIFLVIMIILMSERSTRFARLIGRRNPVATLTTLILFSYNELLGTIIAALSFAVLDYPDGSQEIVWLPDATVGYLRGKHIALFIVALLILLAGLAYTALLFSWQWLLHYQHKKVFKWVRNQRLCQFIEPYHAPYTFKHRYWIGLFLLVRVILYLSSALNVSRDHRMNLLATGIVVTIILLLKGQLGINGSVYTKRLVDILETICCMNLIFLCFIDFYMLEAKTGKTVVAYISGSITLALLLAVVAHHIRVELCPKKSLCERFNMLTFKGTRHNEVESIQEGRNPSADTHQRDPAELSVLWVAAPQRGEQPLSVMLKFDKENDIENDSFDETDNQSKVASREVQVKYSRSSSVDSTAPLL